LEDFAIRDLPPRALAPLPGDALDFGAPPLVDFAFLTVPLLFPPLLSVFRPAPPFPFFPSLPFPFFPSLPFPFFPSLPLLLPSLFLTAPFRGRPPRGGLI
jgi:hypothetical protein